MNQALPQKIVDELDLGPGRGGRAGVNKAQLQIEVARSLTEEDLPSILSPPPVPRELEMVKSIRHSHHRLAQLIAEGKPGAEIALVTGYSQSYISSLQNDPAFEELVSYYSSQRETIFVDAQERLKALGIDATEKLHEVLHDPEAKWTKRELMEVITMALPQGRPGPGPGPGNGQGSNLSLEVKFVGAQPVEGRTIEANFTDITPVTKP